MGLEITFQIEYTTQWGSDMTVEYYTSLDDLPKVISCQTFDGKQWETTIHINERATLYYRYIVQGIKTDKEGQGYRSLALPSLKLKAGFVTIKDQWRTTHHASEIYNSSAFQSVWSKKSRPTKSTLYQNLTFRVNVPILPKGKSIAVIGNLEELGEWKNPIVLNVTSTAYYETSVKINADTAFIQYKYQIINQDKSIQWEEGDNRHYHLIGNNKRHIIQDEYMTVSIRPWRGAGMAIPVFSLRSENSFGIGEFLDLKPAIDLCKNMDLKLIQVLPINDTIAQKSWTDSYPYAAISINALHPLYINLSAISDLKKEPWYKDYINDKSKINQLLQIDFEEVLALKSKYLLLLYQKQKDDFFDREEIKDFVQNNNWIKDYSVFCHLRDKYHTPDFAQWGKEQEYTSSLIYQYWQENSPVPEVGYYVFIQYHLDRQLKDVKSYGIKKGIVLKGDLPIGIYRFSCDAWIDPKLFHMDQQAGAPPDDYAVDGQNWGFPTYNWHEMAKDNFSWWQTRMVQLATYFDALRIDHILGFFRIWSIPMYQTSGTLGLFYPRLPLSYDELRSFGIDDDIKRYTVPYIRKHHLIHLFGDNAPHVASTFFNEVFTDAYTYKSEFDTQSKLIQAFENHALADYVEYKQLLIQMQTEVLLIEDPDRAGYYNPRITAYNTRSYYELPDDKKHALMQVYNNYFFTRHNTFWKEQAYWKLPAILDASNMLICGEDLGMIPATVPEVMANLNIIPLEIQRMPKGNATYGQCKTYPYLSVCSPSCHDMSTVRGWWESDHSNAQRYYEEYMHRSGSAPSICTSDIVEYVVRDHMASPSILAIFPIQDLLGMDDEIKYPDAAEEQINVPANPKHYWRYRLHLNLEQIAQKTSLCNKIKAMVKEYHR